MEMIEALDSIKLSIQRLRNTVKDLKYEHKEHNSQLVELDSDLYQAVKRVESIAKDVKGIKK